ncbi:histidine phosphatase family protein [Anthocerotibacter panamensis]|uniref:histidine phosphatase family protein n=1 Tax=Anthocerotibacter panamensis TaxID=2857077 RepID=UPI001C4014A5|nr:histidine phosphatase family protein [Anthocerotibacter panamensis]
MTKLWLVRHGQTDFNAQSRFQGWCDPALNPLGQEQAKALASRLAAQPWQAAYTSDLSRAAQTAHILLQGHGLVAQPLSGLRETHFGQGEGLTWEQMHQRYPQQVRQWQEDRVNQALPDGESLTSVAHRAILALKDEILPEAHGDILVVAHGGTIAMLLCVLMHIDLAYFWQWRVDLCSLTKLEIYAEGAILLLFNDTSHLVVAPC